MKSKSADYLTKALLETCLDFDGQPFIKKLPVKKVREEDKQKLLRAFIWFQRNCEEYINSLAESGKILPMDFKPENFYIVEVKPGDFEADYIRTRNKVPNGLSAKKISKHCYKQFVSLARTGSPIRISVGTETYRFYGL